MAETPHPASQTPGRRQQAVEEATLLSELAKSKGETYHPAVDFASQQFVFASALVR